MSRAPAPLLRHLRTLLDAPALARRTDRELLDAFATRRDEAAFAALVRRHGPMVLNVCRHVLRHEQDAEDAFQATFLVLARKAASLGSVVSIVGWLHGVAHRTALSARKSIIRRRAHAVPPHPTEPVQPVTEAALHELQALLDAEVARLPEKLRAPFVLCCLEGHSKSEAARELGWKQGTVSSRLAKARERLRARLIRRGVTLSAALAAVVLSESTSCAARSEALAQAASAFATRQTIVTGVSPAAARLAQEGFTAAGTAAWKMTALLLLAAGLVVEASAVVRATGSAAPEPALAPENPQAKRAAGQEPDAAKQVRKDRYGDPLPIGAIARLGTARLRHGYAIFDAALSPDGKLLASAGGGRGVCVWEATTGKQLHVFLPKWNQHVRRIAFSPDGKLLAGGDGPVYLWDVATGKELRRLMPEKKAVPVIQVAFSPDGNLLATVDNKLVRLWDVATGQEIKQLEGPECGISALAFAPDGKTLATTYDDMNLRIWDVARGAELHRLLCPPPDTPAPHPLIAFSPDGKLLAVAPFGKKIQLVDPKTGTKVRSWECDSPRTGGLAFSPDGKVLVSGGYDGDLRFWDPATSKELGRWHTRGLPLSSVAFSKDGTKLVTTAYLESGPRLWEVATGKELLNFTGHNAVIEALTFTLDGNALLSGGRDQIVLRWDLATGKETHRFAIPSAGAAHLAFAADGKSMVSVSVNDGAVRVWDVPSGKEVRLLDKLGKQLGMFLPTSLALSPDGRLAAVVNDDKAVHVWDLASGRQLRRFGSGGSITSVAFSPDSKRLVAACGGLNSRTWIWNIESGFMEWTKSTGSVNGPLGVVFSPDGKRLATYGWDGQVRLWDIATTKEIRSFSGGRQGSGQGFYQVTFSPDGRFLAAASAEEGKSVYVWEVKTGLEVRRFQGHVTAVGSVAFSPDGRTLASGGADSMIYLWDVTGRVKDGRVQPLNLSERDVEARWTSLASSDGPRAVKAIWDLATSPKASVPFLRKQLRQPEAVDKKQVQKLIANLDADYFDVRSAAAGELERLGESAEAALRQALAGNPSAEMRQRIEQLLAKLEPGSPQRLRESRAVQAMEYAGTTEARQVLETLAQGPATSLTREAKAALERLAGRAK
jgi:RNA polymerase sigma factor (sigma-70 family)